MPRFPGMYQWNDTLAKRFPHLSKPMVRCLALWTLGMIVARSCALTAVASALGPLLTLKFDTVRERLRDPYREATAKAGRRRCELDLSICWDPWLAWVLEGWQSRQLALARWMRPVWASSSRFWRRACCTGVVPFRSPGRSSRPTRSMRGSRNGSVCWAIFASVCRPIGRHCADRPRPLCQVALRGDHELGLAPVDAH